MCRNIASLTIYSYLVPFLLHFSLNILKIMYLTCRDVRPKNRKTRIRTQHSVLIAYKYVLSPLSHNAMPLLSAPYRCVLRTKYLGCSVPWTTRPSYDRSLVDVSLTDGSRPWTDRNVNSSPTDVSPTKVSWILHHLDKASLGCCVPDRTIR